MLAYFFPRVTGSRSSLKIMLPVPDYVYTMLPMDQIKTMTFNVTPVFFNVGINQFATIAGRFGNNGPQEKNNLDNFKILSEYYRRYKKLNLPSSAGSGGMGIGGKRKILTVAMIFLFYLSSLQCVFSKI